MEKVKVWQEAVLGNSSNVKTNNEGHYPVAHRYLTTQKPENSDHLHQRIKKRSRVHKTSSQYYSGKTIVGENSRPTPSATAMTLNKLDKVKAPSTPKLTSSITGDYCQVRRVSAPFRPGETAVAQSRVSTKVDSGWRSGVAGPRVTKIYEDAPTKARASLS